MRVRVLFYIYYNEICIMSRKHLRSTYENKKEWAKKTIKPLPIG